MTLFASLADDALSDCGLLIKEGICKFIPLRVDPI